MLRDYVFVGRDVVSLRSAGGQTVALTERMQYLHDGTPMRAEYACNYNSKLITKNPDLQFLLCLSALMISAVVQATAPDNGNRSRQKAHVRNKRRGSRMLA